MRKIDHACLDSLKAKTPGEHWPLANRAMTLKPSRVSPIDWMKSIEEDEGNGRRNCAGLLPVRLCHCSRAHWLLLRSKQD